MPLPSDLTLITVTGDYSDILGDGGTGTVLVVLAEALNDSVGKVVITAGTTVVPVVNSRWSVTVPCSDNTVSPSPFPYTIVEQVPGVNRSGTYLLPHALGATIDITQLVAVNPPPPYSMVYAVLAQSNTYTGVNDFTGGAVRVADPVGNHDPVNLEYFNAHGGAAVSSVNGHTGAVVLAAADVGAIPTGTRLDQVTAPAAAVNLNSEKITSLANGSNPADAAAFGQIPTGGAVVAQTSYGLSPANGSATTHSHSDHGHGTPSQTDRGALGLGLVAEPFPILCVNHVDLGASSGYLIAMLVRPGAATVTNLGLWLGTAGSGPSGVNAMALYSEAGLQLAATGDMSASLSNAANNNSYVEAALGTPYACAEATNYYVALLCHMSGQPNVAGILGSGGMTAINVKGHYPAIELSGQASLPSSFTPSAAILAPASFWLAAS